MRRLPQHITNEELLAALESTDNTEVFEYHNDIPHFLAKFKIDQGKYKVRKSLLYKLYRLYSKAPVTQHAFNLTASQFIPLSSSNYYSINVQPLKIASVVHTKKHVGKVNFNASLSAKKHYEKFLLDVGMRRGANWVQAEVLREIYRFYCIDGRRKPRFSFVNFVTVTKLYFTHKRLNSSRAMWFQIDKEIVSRILTVEDLERLVARRLRTKKEQV